MRALDLSHKVVDLATYRALRALPAGGRRSRPRYVLWYPGLGYFRPQQRASSPRSAAKPA
jgi:hypothetical protein